MMHTDSPVPVALRREQAQQRVAANRAVIADAWVEFGQAAVGLEAKARLAVDWTRTLSTIAAVIGGVVAFRRLATRGRAGPALRALATTSVLRRVLPSALRLYLRRP
jgi:hypothetical protein